MLKIFFSTNIKSLAISESEKAFSKLGNQIKYSRTTSKYEVNLNTI